MWLHADNVERCRDIELLSVLSAVGVHCRRLSAAEHRDREAAWRAVYGQCFHRKLRHRHGAKALNEYLHQNATQWMLVPFLSNVPGTPVSVQAPTLSAYDCRGPLTELEGFSNVEFFVSPLDLAWTLVRTHEDFAFGGPYFVRADWIDNCDRTTAT